jgi:hypothetical protein
VEFFCEEVGKVFECCKVSIAMEWVADNVVEDLVENLESLFEFVNVLLDLEFLQAIAAPVVRDVVSFDVTLKVVLFVVHSALFRVEQ